MDKTSKQYTLRVAHLYGDLLNTYGDWGNILALKYYAQKIDVQVYSQLVSLKDPFHADAFDFVLFGGGQDYEQAVVAEDIQNKKEEVTKYIENNGPFLAVCGGFQLLGDYMIMADGTKLEGIKALDVYTVNMSDKQSTTLKNKRLTGDISIKSSLSNETYHGFENHQGRTFLGEKVKPLGTVTQGYGNNGTDEGEGAHYKNTIGSYFHGPILTRNGNLAKEMLLAALDRKYPDVNWKEKLDGVPAETF